MRTDMRVARGLGVAVVSLFLIGGAAFAADALTNKHSNGSDDNAAPAAGQPVQPIEAPEGTETPEPTETPEATETPEPTETPDAAEAPEAAGTPESEESNDATETPEATETPDAAETPETEQADDHGGSGGSGNNSLTDGGHSDDGSTGSD